MPLCVSTERRVGQMGGRGSYMSEFDQQLSRELGDSSRSSPPPTASFPSPHYGHPAAAPAYQQTQTNSAWNPNEAADMGLNPSLPAYQQQRLQQMPSAHTPGDQPSQGHQHIAPSASPLASFPPSPYPQAAQPYSLSAPSQAAAASNGHPYYPSSPAAPTAYNSANVSAPSPYLPSPYPSSATTAPSLPPQQPSTSLPYSPPSPYPNAPPSPYPAASGAAYPAPATSPYPLAPSTYPPPSSAYPSHSPYPNPAPSPYAPPTSSSPYAPSLNPTPSSAAGYMGPSFTSAAYSSSTSAALPPPPPSNYWVTRAQQQPAVSPSKLGLGLGHVDYSDLDPSSMDFHYATKYKPAGQS